MTTHASEGGARAGDVATSICAVLLAEACNTGFEPLIPRDNPALRRSRLSWVRQNYIQAETLTRSNATSNDPVLYPLVPKTLVFLVNHHSIRIHQRYPASH